MTPVSESPTTTPYFDAIVQKAAGLFAAKGYHATSMRDIGREVGVHAGSLYVHLKSKEDLLEAIVNYIMSRSDQDMSEILEGGGSATDKLRAVAARDLRLIGENREFATVYFHEWHHLTHERQQKVVATRDRWEKGLRSIIESGVRSGEFRQIDVVTTGIAFTSILNWSYVWYSPEGDLTTDDLADRFTELLIGGLRAR